MNKKLERWQKGNVCGMTIEEYDAEVRRRFRRRRLWSNVGEILCGIATLALVALLFWLYLLATPDQMSAECEHEYWLMEQRETGNQ